jgi:hypothetical protein
MLQQNNEGQYYDVLPNKIIFSSTLLEKLFGTETSNLILDIFSKIYQLNLLDSEKAVLFPYIVTKYSNKSFCFNSFQLIHYDFRSKL